MIALHFPIPPALDVLRPVHGGKARKAERYKVWERSAKNHLVAQGGDRLPKVEGRHTLTVILDDRRQRHDGEKRLRVLEDFLAHGAGLVAQGCIPESTTLRWGHAPVGCTVLIDQLADMVRAAE